MSEPIPWLIESSIQIAWNYLERAGERAIEAYQRHRRVIAA
ncbi:hypothetical protein [Bradyrhizobium sp. CCBAU 11361]|nr:hypothetical protein [Bradyrhizobium sp. CCBAU 11361]